MTDFKMNVARMVEQGSAPASLANAGKVYTKDVSGVTQHFYMDSAGTEYQITPTTPEVLSVPYSALDTAITIGVGNTLANDTNANDIFASTRRQITLAASTRYKFRAQIYTHRTGSTSVSFSLVFNGGTATFNTFEYMSWVYVGTAVTVVTTTPIMQFVQTAAATTVTTAGTSTYKTYVLEGAIDVNAGGTFLPQLQASGTPGSTTTVDAASYFELTKLGTSSFVSRGGWG